MILRPVEHTLQNRQVGNYTAKKGISTVSVCLGHGGRERLRNSLYAFHASGYEPSIKILEAIEDDFIAFGSNLQVAISRVDSTAHEEVVLNNDLLHRVLLFGSSHYIGRGGP